MHLAVLRKSLFSNVQTPRALVCIENEWSKAIAIDCEVMCAEISLESLIYRSFSSQRKSAFSQVILRWLFIDLIFFPLLQSLHSMGEFYWLRRRWVQECFLYFYAIDLRRFFIIISENYKFLIRTMKSVRKKALIQEVFDFNLFLNKKYFFVPFNFFKRFAEILNKKVLSSIIESTHL